MCITPSLSVIVLTIGSQGSTVRQLQRNLNARFQDFGLMASMSLTVDGVFGPKTLMAVKYLQCVGGFPVSGRVDEATWQFGADGVLGLPELSIGTRRTSVAAVQRSVLAAGIPITVDGYFGVKTSKAIAAYQQRLGLELTGTVDAATWEMVVRSRLTTLPCAALLPRRARR
ncbi:MAG: peptidoglycan-binding protein [Phormidesmis sp.]